MKNKRDKVDNASCSSRLFFILALFTFYFLPFTQSLSLTLKKTTIILPDGKEIEAAVADNVDLRNRGLMERSHLNTNEGMLFLFETSEPHMMWMKNMLISLDIVWLNERKEIIEIIPFIPPCVIEPCSIYGPPIPSRYVLEIKEGASTFFHLRKGMVLKFP